MSNVTSFAAHHRAKHGPQTMRAELARRHEAEWARIEAGDETALDQLVTRGRSATGMSTYVPENEDMRELLLARLGALP